MDMASRVGHSDFAELFVGPTSVYLGGSNRALLNWVAYAVAAQYPSGFTWMEIRLRDQLLDEQGPVSRRAVPPDRLRIVSPADLEAASAAAAAADPLPAGNEAVREPLRRLAASVPLEDPAPGASNAGPAGPAPRRLLVVSNAHRIAAMYPDARVGAALQGFLDAGSSLLLTFADAPPTGRLAFQHVHHLEGLDLREWRTAVLSVEKGTLSGRWAPGNQLRLSELPMTSQILEEGLGFLAKS